PVRGRLRRRCGPGACEPDRAAEHRNVRVPRRSPGTAGGARLARRGSSTDPRRGRSGALAGGTGGPLPGVRGTRRGRQRSARRGRRRDRGGAPLERVTVRVSGRSYQVIVGSGVLERADELVPAFPAATQAFVVTDRTVHDAWFPSLAAAFDRVGLHGVPLLVPAGEEAKTLDVYRALLHQLATQEAHRDDPIGALGGGSTGDLAGFVAATY